MQLSDRGKALIKSFEKLALLAYRDGGGVWTIGWGHTGPDVGPGVTCSVEQAERWFEIDTAKAVAAVLRGLDVPLNQNQFDALVSFTYNVGAGHEAHSTLLKLLNQSQFTSASREFVRWDHVNGAECAGLLKRREAERALFLEPAPEPR